MHRSPRRLTATVVAAIVAVAGLSLASAPTAQATAAFDLERIAGDNRFSTAAEIARTSFPDGTSEAIIANGLNFPDALAATYLAGRIGAPILLAAQPAVPPVTLDGLADLGVTDVTLVGGEGVLGAAVVGTLEDEGYTVSRIAGENRFDTAERIARTPGVDAVGDIDGDATAIIANGLDFPDALVAGPLSAAEAFPILLSGSAGLHPDARAALTALSIDRVLLVGGTGVLSGQIRTDLEDMGIGVQRLAGQSRFQTAAAVAAFAWDTLGFDPEHLNIATGLAFPDAIAGGVLGGIERAPLLLGAGTVPLATCTALEDRAATVSSGHLFGGPAAVTSEAESGLESCAGALASNQTFAVSPGGDKSVVIEDTRSFVVSDLGDASAIDVGLIDCANISISGGVVTFAVTEGSATGLGATDAASITSLNGVEGDNGDLVSDATVVDGEITLEVTADAVGCVSVVAWSDGDADDALAVSGAGEPTEPFGASGRTIIFDVAGLAVTPGSPQRPFSSPATTTAQVLDSNDVESPASGIPVLFTVEELSGTGFDGGGCGTIDPSVERTEVATGTVDTNLAGAASFTHDGPADPASLDTVIHCVTAVLDLDGSGDSSDGDLTGEAQIEFNDDAPEPAAVELDSPGVTALIGTQATFGATLFDQFGDPMSNRVLTFELFRTGSTAPRLLVERTTDAEGQARLTVTGPENHADDTVVVCLEDPSDSTQTDADDNPVGSENDRCDVVEDDDTDDDVPDEPNDSTPFQWMIDPATSTTTAHDSCVLSASAKNHTVDVEDAGSSGRNLRLRYDADDQFNLVTTQGPVASTDPILLSAFRDMADVGDRIHAEYSPGGVSTFTLYDDDNCTQDITAGEASTNGAFG